jgi:hypothetical protein
MFPYRTHSLAYIYLYIFSKHNTSKEGIFVPLKVTKFLAPKVGEKFSIFVFQMGRISNKMQGDGKDKDRHNILDGVFWRVKDRCLVFIGLYRV